jgi:release factor glutamine methyltransferase
MNEAQPWTIQRLLTWTADYFRQKGSDSPRLDAEVLLAAILGCQRIDLYVRFDQVPGADELARFRALVQRRAAGEPVAYLTGHKEFFSVPLAVSPAVLIPRPETELLVVETLDQAKKVNLDRPLLIADIGTGSGNIAIALAKHLPEARIWGADLSPAAIDIAAKNAAVNELSQRCHFLQGDLLEPLAKHGPFDFIVSNPPYIGQAERATLPDSVVKFEPESALFSTGPEGTEVIFRLIDESLDVLRPGGFLLLEISPIVAERVRSKIAQSAGWELVAIKKDLAGLERVAIARKKSA